MSPKMAQPQRFLHTLRRASYFINIAITVLLVCLASINLHYILADDVKAAQMREAIEPDPLHLEDKDGLYFIDRYRLARSSTLGHVIPGTRTRAPTIM